ncbi:ectonucleotide pyrophosphatase/phosphodiesterase family member 7-like [Nelusetta ayraudi]|uniref:ectonucleotide pyrophosphatase/phosphodiesterase family member 7-like n=1 Tax=Nelusetta ayraudi TaxID=303726 RepID=UPI003F7210FE
MLLRTIVLALALLLAACGHGSLAAPLSSGRPKLLLISFDGFRWDYDRDVETPYLDQMVLDGVKAPFVTPAYLTVTSPAHFTLLTGRYIENHGVVHNMWFNTTSGIKKPYYQTQFVDEWWDNGTVPIWITAQRQGRRVGSLHFPGTAATYQGETPLKQEVEPIAYDYKSEKSWQENTDTVMRWFSDEDLDFVALYFGEPDGTGHLYGPESEQRRNMVRQVDRHVGFIRDSTERHGLSGQLNIIMTADHGMSTVYRNGEVDEIILTKIPGFSFSDLSFHLVDYGPTGMLLPKPGKLETVYQALKGAHPHLHVYKKEELPQHLHFSKNDRILPIVMFADPGYVINGYFPVQFNKGEHGYDNQEMDMKPFFRAVGPAFHRNLEVEPFETVDIYPLMCHILGITQEVNDGNLDNVKRMLATNHGQPNYMYKAFIGLAAVAGFLALATIAFIGNKVLSNRKGKIPRQVWI